MTEASLGKHDEPVARGNEFYPKLRDWYLARLRQEALEEAASVHLTPITRIESDRVAIENIVLQSAANASSLPSRRAKPSIALALPLLCMAANMLALVVIMLAFDVRFVDAASLFVAAAGILIGIVPAVGNSAIALSVAATSLFGAPAVVANVLPAKTLFSAAESLASTNAGQIAFRQERSVPLVFFSIALCASLFLAVATIETGRFLSGFIAWQCVLLLIYSISLRVEKMREFLHAKRATASIKDCLSEDQWQNLQSERCSTERLWKEILEALRVSVTRERAIADCSRDMICAFDENFQVVAINQAITGMTGYSPSDLLYQSFLRFFVEPNQTELEDKLGRARTGKDISRFETRLVAKSGALLDLSWVVDWSEHEQIFFAVARDVTAERAIQRARQEYAAMIAHDVRTPLTSIMFGLNNLLEGRYGELNEPQANSLCRGTASITRVLNLLNEIIDLERSADSKLELELSKFRIHDLMLSVADQLLEQSERQGTRIEIVGDNHFVRADANRVERILFNLLSNALKHSPAGEAVVLSVVGRQAEVEIRVTDKGPGIPKQLQSAVFERFVQLNLPGERKNAGAGSGLGLAVCKALVQSHGASIGVDSETGKGSTFWFTLPI